jgi:hypothetical protein
MRIIYERSMAADGQAVVREVKVRRDDRREIGRKWFGTAAEMDRLAKELEGLGKVVVR